MIYDAAYYDAYRSASGVPYGRHPVWLGFFASIAGRIVAEIGPRTVLDAGCAKGLLVEALRDRGIDAEGLDISAYAIGEVREDVRPHCRVASILDPLPRRYDLVVCLEVLEHLAAADAARAVENLCRATDDVLFSSTPADDGDPTHVDIQPVEAWAALFARQGFTRDLDFDAGFVAPHAMRFRRRAASPVDLVRDYERTLWAARERVAEHERLNLALTADTRALGAANDTLAAANDALNAANEALLATRRTLTADAAWLRAETARLEAALAAAGEALEETRTRLEGEVAAAREATGRLEQDLEAVRARRARTQEQLAETLQQRYGLERALAGMSAERARLEQALAEAAEERAGLERALAREAGERASVEASLAAEGARLRDAQARLAGVSAEAARLAEYVHAIEGTVTWMLAQRLRRARARWAPAGSRRAAALRWLTALARRALGAGRAPAMRAVPAPGPPPQAAAPEAPALAPGAPAPTERGPEPEARAPAATAPAGALDVPARAGARRVLMVSGTHGAMERYRCHHAREQLESLDIACDLRHFTQPGLGALVPGAEVLVLHRVPFATPVGELIDAARRHGVPVLFDVDDLVFDPTLVDRLAALDSMTTEERALYLDGVCRYRQTLERCDGALVTTEALADAVAALGKPAWVHRNALGREMIALAEAARAGRRARPDRVVIGYASGSRTHDRDFAEAASSVEAMLERHAHVDLAIIGHLDPGTRWRRWGERVRRVPFVPWQELPALLADLDINLAPLEPNSVFCAAKSELKYVEAAAVGVPTVASRVGAFQVAIRHDDTGLLVTTAEEWLAALERLVLSPADRQAMGARARADVLARYGPAVRAAELRATLDTALAALRAPGAWPGAGAAPPPTIFKEHALAHELLDGLRGLEIGAAAHNPFGLDTRNVATPEDYAFYAEHQLRELRQYPARVDIWAPADRLPVPERGEDFVLSSHVVEHLPDLVGTLVEWDRVVRDGGYVFMIVPLKGVLPEDGPRPLTPLEHFIEDWQGRMTADTHPTDGVPGGALGHYHTFTPDSLLEVIAWMRGRGLCDWELVAREDVDSKVGNGFTLAFRVRHG